MITRETRKLIGLVKKVEAEFAVYENIDGKLTEIRNQSAGYSIYDFGGRLIEEVSLYRQMMQDSYKDVYFYNEKGELDYREEYDLDDSLMGKSVFEKSPNGNLKEKHYYFDDQKKLKLDSHFIFDGENNDSEEGLIIEKVYYDANEKIIPRHSHRNDLSERNKKNLIKNDEGYTIEELRANEKGEFSHRIKTIYDLKGNEKEYFCYESDGTLYLKKEYTYKFDSTGNWIEKIDNHWVTGWGEFKLTPLSITRRKIEYFD